MALGKILNIKGQGCMPVCKMFVLNLMKKFWLASGRVLASSEKMHFVSVTLFEGNYATIELFSLC